MSAPRTYTERVAVRIPSDLREAAEEQLGDVGLAAALRDATLRAIGQDKLVEGPARDETGHKAARKPSNAASVVIPVPLTREQRTVIDVAAKGQEMSRSALMLQSLLFELRLEPKQWSGRAWTFGRRRSSAPKAKPTRKRAPAKR